ncbi:MAG: APC family permease [Candidatus Hydrogenedentes bacterium]|nr:APC family permease [Candidatus Hydrogenedentota bacterium]
MTVSPENASSISAATPIEQELAKPVTLLGGVALVVGGVIGIGIYALIAQISIAAGTSQWLAFLIAIAISMVGVTPLMQLSSAMPKAGGGYYYAAHLMSPAMGALTSSWAILGGACSTCVVTVGLAKYISQHIPGGVPDMAISFAILAVFFAMYQFGLKLAMWLQIAMVVQLFLALTSYAALGAVKVPISFALDFPKGAGGFAMGTILCYSVCMGFQVIAEMGEEMQHAKRNIPLSLGIGGVIVLVLYVAVGATFVNSIPYDPEHIRAMKAPLSESAALFMPAPLVFFLGIGALSAGLTSLNAAAIALPREVFAQAREGVLPAWLGVVNGRTRSPLHAETAFFVLVFVLLGFNASIDYYGIMAAVGILLMTVMLSIASVRLPRRMPAEYGAAYLQIPPALLKVTAVVAVATSLGFMLIVISEAPSAALVYVVFSVVVLAHYAMRSRQNPGNDIEH